MTTQKKESVMFAIVGCGAIGTRHVAVLDAEARAEIVGLCDVDLQKCQVLSKTYGSIPCFSNYTEMLSNIRADVITIATPNYLHASMAIEAMEKGFNVLVEKPMALTVAEGEDMINVALKHNVRLMVVKQNRFNAPIALATETINAGRLGRIFMTKASVLWNRNPEYYSGSNWRGKKALEGGALYTQASHFIDILTWWCGDVTDVESVTATKNHEIEIEDCGSALLRFENGALGVLDWTTCVYNKNFEGSITIIGENGTIKIGGPYLNKIEFWDVKDYPLPEETVFEDRPNNYSKYQGTSSNHDKVIRAVIDSLLHEKPGIVGGEEGLKTVAAIEKIYGAARKWK